MVGTPARGEHRGNILQGDAKLVYYEAPNTGFTAGCISATFDSIKDLTRNAAYGMERVGFASIPVGLTGTYRSGGYNREGDYISDALFRS